MPEENNPALTSKHQVSDEAFVRVKGPERQLSAQRVTTLELASMHQVTDYVFVRVKVEEPWLNAQIITLS